MLYSLMGYQPFKLIFGNRAPTFFDVWLRLASFNDNYLQSKHAWVNKQHEIILAAKAYIKACKAECVKTVFCVGCSALEIPTGV